MNCALSTAPTLYIVFVWPPNFTMFISIERRTWRFVYLSSPVSLTYLPGTVLGEGRGTGDEVVEVGVREPELRTGASFNPGTFSTTMVI